MDRKKKISIIGGGVSAMILATELDDKVFDIQIYEKGNAIGKKFLVAGKGGFNLTHSEAPETFIKKYEPSSFIKTYFDVFNNEDLRKWFNKIDIPTIIGSSKKIYPQKGIKPIQVLEAIRNKIKENNVSINYNHEFVDIDKGFFPVFKTKNSLKVIKSDIVIFALGGASWEVTGSDGKWLSILNKQNVNTKEFEPSNCAFEVDWDKEFIKDNEGKPLKNIATHLNGKYIKGELMITKFGLEGGAIYAMSGELRKSLSISTPVKLNIDLKPTFTIKEIETKLKIISNTYSTTKALKQYLKLNSTQIKLLKYYTTKEEFNNKSKLAHIIKNLIVPIIGIADIDEAISTVGGISLNAVDENLKIKTLPFHYAIGEMLDWDAPTGGYLLQASFSMGYYLAKYLNNLKKYN